MDNIIPNHDFMIPSKRQSNGNPVRKAATPNKPTTSTTAMSSTSPSSRANEPAAGSVPEFIQKLFRMLENKSFRHTFCWGPDGTTFVVKDTNEFSKSILPKHFKHCNFASFVRQLNKYDFHKVRNADDGPKPYGEQAWEFVHPKFRRDRKDLLEEIRRKTPGKQKKEDSASKDSNASSSSSLAAANAATASAAANASSTSINMNSNDTAIKLESDQNDSISEFRQLTESLQARIDQLQRSQLEMEEKMTRLTRNDELVMTELQNFSKSMLAKDELLREVLDLVVKRDKDSTVDGLPSPATQKLVNTYTQVSQNSQDQLGAVKKQMGWDGQNSSSSSSSESVPAPVAVSEPVQPVIPSQPISNPMPAPYPPDPSSATPSAAAAAAAASMNAGSIIGSPLKTADGVTFVTLGRLAPQMATHNDKPTLEIQPHTQPAMPPKSATPGTSSSQQPSVADPTFTPQPTHTLSVRRKPNGNGGWTVPPRILLVDDDSVYRDLSGKLLQVIGCTIDLAKDGVEAIKKMGLEKYDLILMDIVMPNLDGISATRNIRQYDLLTPIISMTSNFTDNDIMQYVGSGMTDILPKPFSKRTLYSMLEKYCAHLKVIQQFQEPNVVHRGLGTIMPSDGFIEEITSSNEVASSSASTSAAVMPVIASSSSAGASSSSSASSSSLSYPSTSYPTTVSPVPTTTPFLSQWPQQQQQPQQQPQAISIMPSDDGNKFLWAVPSQAEQDGNNGKKRRIE